MRAHGHGDKTFRFETDAQGEPLVHRVDGSHPDSYYLDSTFGPVRAEVGQAFDLSQGIYFIVVDNSTDRIGKALGSTFWGNRSKNHGIIFVPGGFHWTTAAHELGHAFGLEHDFRDGKYIMSYGSGEPLALSVCHAEYLTVHPYFNPDISNEEAPPPTIELISPTEYPEGSTSVSIQLRVSDPDGIALDVGRGKMYWTDRGTGKIRRANLDGSNVEDLIRYTEDLLRYIAIRRVPFGIALDLRDR